MWRVGPSWTIAGQLGDQPVEVVTDADGTATRARGAGSGVAGGVVPAATGRCVPASVGRPSPRLGAARAARPAGRRLPPRAGRRVRRGAASADSMGAPVGRRPEPARSRGAARGVAVRADPAGAARADAWRRAATREQGELELKTDAADAAPVGVDATSAGRTAVRGPAAILVAWVDQPGADRVDDLIEQRPGSRPRSSSASRIAMPAATSPVRSASTKPSTAAASARPSRSRTAASVTCRSWSTGAGRASTRRRASRRRRAAR